MLINERGVNYNTYFLGHEGYLSLNLVTNMSNIEQNKLIAKEMKILSYITAALVGGVAVKKLGLLMVT
jgi:uncharacterized membrane-anchored protein